MSAMGAPPLAPTQEALALFAGDGGNSGSMPRRNNESANSLASLEETQRALVAPGSPPSEGAWEAPALGANVAGVFARAPASPMHVDARARLTASPSAGLSPISMALRAAPGRAKRAPPPAWAPGTRHAPGATGAAHDDAGPEPPPTPAEKAAVGAKKALSGALDLFEVVQGRPYTPLKSKAVEDAVKPIASSAVPSVWKSSGERADVASTAWRF